MPLVAQPRVRAFLLALLGRQLALAAASLGTGLHAGGCAAGSAFGRSTDGAQPLQLEPQWRRKTEFLPSGFGVSG
jgi:hypothetical protein